MTVHATFHFPRPDDEGFTPKVDISGTVSQEGVAVFTTLSPGHGSIKLFLHSNEQIVEMMTELATVLVRRQEWEAAQQEDKPNV